ncbi:hypothetical protein [uncultured Shewanella sp.]|uniref:hypothetical protein n=1 Tax=uncultured Shewanella sp. TaxID=173975 RepID=UPI00261DBD54|nr:hypothetical protein [uncultured Shewanella sp.]
MSTEQTANLIESVTELTATVANKMGVIDNRMAQAEATFDEWRNQRDLHGEASEHGTVRMGILQGFVNTTDGLNSVNSGTGAFANVSNLETRHNIYLHFKTPLNINTHAEMFWFNIKGYSYGSACIIDETIVGYCYKPNNKLINQSAFGSLNPSSYADVNGNVILRILLPSSYYTTCRVDTMRVGNGRLFNEGDLEAKFSLEEKITFD